MASPSLSTSWLSGSGLLPSPHYYHVPSNDNGVYTTDTASATVAITTYNGATTTTTTTTTLDSEVAGGYLDDDDDGEMNDVVHISNPSTSFSPMEPINNTSLSSCNSTSLTTTPFHGSSTFEQQRSEWVSPLPMGAWAVALPSTVMGKHDTKERNYPQQQRQQQQYEQEQQRQPMVVCSASEFGAGGGGGSKKRSGRGGNGRKNKSSGSGTSSFSSSKLSNRGNRNGNGSGSGSGSGNGSGNGNNGNGNGNDDVDSSSIRKKRNRIEQVDELENEMRHVYLCDIVPLDHFCRTASALIAELSHIVYTVFKGAARTEVAGSIAQGLETRHSDLDLVVVVGDGITGGPAIVPAIRALRTALIERSRHNLSALHRAFIETIEGARVPLVKIHLSGGFQCDIAFNQQSSVAGVRLIRSLFAGPAEVAASLGVAGLPVRQAKSLSLLATSLTVLTRLVKHWLIRRNIPNSRTGGLNTYVWTLLVAHYLLSRQARRGLLSMTRQLHRLAAAEGNVRNVIMNSSYNNPNGGGSGEEDDEDGIINYNMNREKGEDGNEVFSGIVTPPPLFDLLSGFFAFVCDTSTLISALSLRSDDNDDQIPPAYHDDMGEVPVLPLVTKSRIVDKASRGWLKPLSDLQLCMEDPLKPTRDLCGHLTQATWLTMLAETVRGSAILESAHLNCTAGHSTSLDSVERLFSVSSQSKKGVEDFSATIPRSSLGDHTKYCLLLLADGLAVGRIDKLCKKPGYVSSSEPLFRNDNISRMHVTLLAPAVLPVAARHPFEGDSRIVGVQHSFDVAKSPVLRFNVSPHCVIGCVSPEAFVRGLVLEPVVGCENGLTLKLDAISQEALHYAAIALAILSPDSLAMKEFSRGAGLIPAPTPLSIYRRCFRCSETFGVSSMQPPLQVSTNLPMIPEPPSTVSWTAHPSNNSSSLSLSPKTWAMVAANKDSERCHTDDSNVKSMEGCELVNYASSPELPQESITGEEISDIALVDDESEVMVAPVMTTPVTPGGIKRKRGHSRPISPSSTTPTPEKKQRAVEV